MQLCSADVIAHKEWNNTLQNAVTAQYSYCSSYSVDITPPPPQLLLQHILQVDLDHNKIADNVPREPQ